MSKRYPGNFITGNPVALSQTSNNGIWDLKDNYQATNNGTWREANGIYEIGRSLRFRSSVTAYLNRTPIVAGNRKTWTFSAWIKRCNVSGGGTAYRNIFCAYSSGNTYSDIAFAGTNGDRLRIYQQTGGGDTWYAEPNMYFRDPSAWYHIVVAFDNTLSAAGDRIKLYVNGVQQTFASYTAPAQNTDYLINSTNVHYINYIPGNTPNDMYMAETNFIDGQAFDSSYFGYFDPITNIWQPKKYTGNYGTNGFYLPFNQYGSTLMLGKNAGNPSNLLTYSEQFDNAAWLKPAAPVAPTVTANSTTAPDGTTTADTLNWSGATAHPVYQETTVPTFTLGDTYTFSVYLKKSTAGQFNIQVVWFYTAGGNQDGYVYATFDSNGILTSFTPSNSYIQATAQFIGNGWYRVSCTSTYQGGGAGTLIRGSVGQGSGASSVYAWGAQFNLGNTPDTYLQTTSSALNQTWTPNNFSVAPGVTYDSMVDSPTNVFTTATDVGGVVPGNYCTLNSAFRAYGGNTYSGTFSNANLSYASQGNPSHGFGTIAVPSTSSTGYYWEVTCTSMDTARTYIGMVDPYASPNIVGDGASYGFPYKALISNPGEYRNFASGTAGGAQGTYTSFAANDTIRIAYKNGSIWFGKNDTWMNSGNPAAGTGALDTGIDTSKTWLPYVGYNSSFTLNFGQRPFTYAPPAGFVSLNTTNLQALGTAAVGKAAIQPNKWMDISLYGGTGAARDITNSGFQPDLVWIKHRSSAENHNIYDSARGPGLRLESNSTAVEFQYLDRLTSFNNNGFSLGSGYNNTSGTSYIAWQWKQSPTAGFNVVSYTGDGTNNRAISHNLGVTPAFIIVKDTTVGYNWDIYHQSLGISATMIFSTGTGTRNASAFGSTAPTSSNFFTQNSYTNSSGSKMIAYLWAEVPGFSKFGSYAGNSSSDGPFIYCGFRPKMIIIRSTSAAREWNVWDTARGPYNINNFSQLDWSQSHAEYAGDGYNNVVDFLSNGFKLRNAVSPNYNQGETYVYAAFAESPFGLNNRAR